MKSKDDLKKEINELRALVKEAKSKKQQLDKENAKLQDEVDSLWAMMDEMTKSDIQNWSSILEQLEKDTVVKALMVTKNKAEA
jgi:predicted nuclease with TOPRIM domain